MVLQLHDGENLVMQAVMEEFDPFRAVGNITYDIVDRERVSLFNKAS